MGIKMEPNPLAAEVDIDLTVSATNEDSKSKRKEAKYTNASLPFPQNEGRQGLKKWQQVSLPMLYDWAGSLPQPFASNSNHAYLLQVQSSWVDVFPKLAAQKGNPAIENLVRFFLCTHLHY